jgi:hypothetical protein
MLRLHNKEIGAYVRHKGGSIMPVGDSQSMQMAPLERILGYVVVHSWDDLMPGSTSGLIHIEYQTGRNGSLDFLKIWTSTTRGYWRLISELWIRPLWSHATGLWVDDDYRSVDFPHTLELVIGQEDAFSKLPDQHGLIQIYPPTQEEREEAERWMRVAFNDHGSMPIEQDIAA